MMSALILFLVYMVMDRRDERRRGADHAGKLEASEEFHARDLLDLLKNRSYIFIVLLCASFYAAVFPFQDYLADLLKHKFGYDEVKAGDMTSLIPYAAALFTILFGAFVDKKGKRATLMLGGAALLVVTHLCFGLTTIPPVVLVPLFGISFSLVPAAMWPAVALIVEEKRLGTAYGLMTWMQNLWWWAMSLLAGLVLDRTNPGVTPETIRDGTGVYDYTATMMTLAGLGVIAFFMAIGLKAADRRKDSHGLELPSAEAAAFNEARRGAATG
jgi:predicted MFS family arabinose efflux permease